MGLRSIRILLEKHLYLLQKDIKNFFIKYDDPCYIKIEKLEILTTFCDDRNFEIIVPEVAEYALDVDQYFAPIAIKALSKICLRVDEAAIM